MVTVQESTYFTKIDAKARFQAAIFCGICIRRSASPRKATLFEVLY